MLSEMMKYNEELAKAGVLLAADGLPPSSRGAQVRFSGSKRTVIDGPFTETKDLIAGFWLIEAKSLAEAIEWVKRAPSTAWKRLPRSASCSTRRTSPRWRRSGKPFAGDSPDEGARLQIVEEG